MTDQLIAPSAPSDTNNWFSTTQAASSSITSAPTSATLEPSVPNAPTITTAYVPSGGSVQQPDGSVTLTSPSTFLGQTINQFLGGYTTQQIQGMTDAQRSTLLSNVQSNYQIAANDSGLFGTGISGTALDVYNYLKTLASPDTLPSIKQAALMPEYLTPGDKSGNSTLLGLLGLSSNFNPAGGTGEVTATPSGTAGSIGGSTTADNGASSGTTSIANGGTAVNRLIDLAAAMYAGAGVNGGGTGFGGLVGGPLGSDATGSDVAAPAATTSHTGLIVVVLILAGLAFWWYKKHKKGA